jgi:hypothetical protein
MSGATLAISFQTVAELLYWAEESTWGQRRRAALDEFIAHLRAVSAMSSKTAMARSFHDGRTLLEATPHGARPFG